MWSGMPPRYDLGPRPHLGYTQSLIDRVAQKLGDAIFYRAPLVEMSSAITDLDS